MLSLGNFTSCDFRSWAEFMVTESVAFLLGEKPHASVEHGAPCEIQERSAKLVFWIHFDVDSAVHLVH